MAIERNQINKVAQGIRSNHTRSNYKGVPDLHAWSGCIRLNDKSIARPLLDAVPEMEARNIMAENQGVVIALRSSLVAAEYTNRVQERRDSSKAGLISTVRPLRIQRDIRSTVELQLPRNLQGRALLRSKKGIDKEVSIFEPSKDLSLNLLRIFTKKHSELDKQLERYKENLSTKELEHFNNLTENLPDSSFNSYNVDVAGEQIKKEVASLLATIARSQGALGDTDYVLTENSILNDDVHGALSERLQLGIRTQEFMSKLGNELIHSTIRFNVGGKWGALEYKQGELVMNIQLKNKIEKRKWTKAETI